MSGLTLHIPPGYPDFSDLPWHLSLREWPGVCQRLADAPRGVSRHPVVYVNYNSRLFAIKELPPEQAASEMHILKHLQNLRLPAVTPVAWANLSDVGRTGSVLITSYLERSLPYRTLFINDHLHRYRSHLLDAMAWLVVQLHLAGIYWGDCSLSNTLFRRDAGTLQAYLVDAETSEIYPHRLEPTLRHQDLEIMEVNVVGDLTDLANAGYITSDFPIHQTGEQLRQRYRALWDEVARDQEIGRDEYFRIRERIRALNELGFSVADVELPPNGSSERLRLRVVVSDRNFHRDLLFDLAGLEVEERQAQKMLSEIYELRASLSRDRNQSLPLSTAALIWQETFYQPVVARLQQLVLYRQEHPEPSEVDPITDLAELYCQVLEHKWYLSEQAQSDVGHLTAVDDYLQNIARDLRNLAG